MSFFYRGDAKIAEDLFAFGELIFSSGKTYGLNNYDSHLQIELYEHIYLAEYRPHGNGISPEIGFDRHPFAGGRLYLQNR